MLFGDGHSCLTGIRKPAGDGRGASGNNHRGTQSAPEMTLVLGSAAVAAASRQGLGPVALGQDSTTGTRPQASLCIGMTGRASGGDRRQTRHGVKRLSDETHRSQDAVGSHVTRFLRMQVRVWFADGHVGDHGPGKATLSGFASKKASFGRVSQRRKIWSHWAPGFVRVGSGGTFSAAQ